MYHLSIGISIYTVSGIIRHCKSSKGYRSSIYNVSQECHAYYIVENGVQKSIYYPDGSQDLHIRLAFQQKTFAEDFQNKLLYFSQLHQHFRDKLTLVDHISSTIINASELDRMERVFYHHYIPADNNESPEISMNDVLGTASLSAVSVSTDPRLALQALESPSFLEAFGSKWYKCHLISQTNSQFRDDPDNVLYASWNFHQIFDGLNTIDGIGVAIKVETLDGSVDVVVAEGKYEKRSRLTVKIIFRTASLSNFFSGVFKDGTVRVNDLEFLSFLYARDADRMQIFLTHKYDRTMEVWRREDDELVDT